MKSKINKLTEYIIKEIGNLSEEISVCIDFVSSKKLCDSLIEIINNTPSLYYVNSFDYSIKANKLTIAPIYNYNNHEVSLITNECKQTASKLVDKINSKSCYEFILKAHDILAKNVIYFDDNKIERHSIVGALLEKKAVCEGFAKSYKYLLDVKNIPNRLVCGKTVNVESGNIENHVWNLVKFPNDQWAHVDVTFDSNLIIFDEPRHDYFGLNSNQIVQDHEFDISDYPIAETLSNNYYIMFKKDFCNIKNAEDYVSSRLQSKESNISLRCLDIANYQIAEKLIENVLMNPYNKYEVKEYIFDFNQKQNILAIYIKYN